MNKSIMYVLVILVLAQNCLAGEKSLVEQAETVLKNASVYFQSISTQETKSRTAIRKNGCCSFDDNTSQGALSFLMSMDAVIDELWLSDAIELGLRHMMKSQFENGAWPQWYPLIGGYHDYYTFNDNAINDCIKVMLKAPSSTPTISNPHGPAVLSPPGFAARRRSEIFEHWLASIFTQRTADI